MNNYKNSETTRQEPIFQELTTLPRNRSHLEEHSQEAVLAVIN